MKFYVYMIFDVNGKPRYVGKGSGKRWQTHLTNSHNKQLRGMLKSADEEMPIVIVRDNMVEADAFDLENKLILTLGRKDQRKGPLLNHTDGGDGVSGLRHSEKSRRDMSLAKKGIKYGPRPKWHGEAISQGRKGYKPTDEARKNMSDAAKRRIARDGVNVMCRTPTNHSEETKLKMSRTHTGMKRSAESIKKSADAQRGISRGPMTEEQKNKIRMALKDKPWSAKRRAAEALQ